MNKVLQSDFRTTIEAFRAFIEDRPDDEKWELIDGEIVLNPTANNRHQMLVRNLLFELEGLRRKTAAPWNAIPGISTRHPQDQHSEPIPDVMIVPPTSEIFNWTYDVLVVFETLSPFSLRRDMVHKKKFYTKIDSLSHYIVLAQDRREANIFSRANGFELRKISVGAIEMPELGVSLAMDEIYRDVPVG